MAEIDGGGLHFKSELDNDAINKAIEETMDKIGGLSSSLSDSGKEISKVFDDMAKDAKDKGLSIEVVFNSMKDQIDNTFVAIDQIYETHKASLSELLDEQQRVSQAMGDAFMAGRDGEYRAYQEQLKAIEGEISMRKRVIAEVEKQADELTNVESSMNAYIEKTKASEAKTATFEAQIRRVRSAMQAMLKEGVDPLDEGYQKLQMELTELMGIQRSVQAQGKALSHNQAGLAGAISGLQGLAGAMSSATGVVSLFAGKNDDLTKVMTRLQSVMAITMGLQQVSAVLHKDSAFQLTVVAGVKNKLAIATTKLGTALNISDVAAKRLLTTLTLGLSVIIPGIISLISKQIEKTNEAKKAQDEYYKSIADNVYKPIGSLKLLETQYNSLGNSMKDKERFIKDNKQEFEKLGIVVNGVADAERLLTDPTNVQRFVDAQLQKAKATAQLQSVMDKQQKLQQKQLEYDRMPDQISQFVQTDGFGGGYYQTVENINKINLKKQIDGLNADLQFGYKLVAQTEQQGADMLKEINKEANEAIKGSIVYYRDLIREKSEAMEVMTNPGQIRKAQAEIKDLQKILDSLENKKKEKKEKDPFAETLSKAKEEYSKYLSFTNSTDEQIRASAQDTFRKQLEQGGSYIEFLTNKREELLKGDQTAETIRRIKLVNEQIANETQKQGDDEIKRQNEHLQQLVENYYLYYDTRKKIEEEFNFDMKELNAQLMSAQGDAQKEFVQTMIDNRTRTYKRDMKSAGSGDPEYDALVKSYQDFETFEEKKLRITEKYAEERAKAIEKGDTALADRLNKSEQKDLQQLSFDEILGSDTWAQLFGNLDQLTVDKMIELRNKIESEWSNLDLTPEQFNAIRNKINEVTDAIQSKNPFKALLDSINRYKKGEKGVDFKDIAKSAGASIKLVGGAFDAVVDGMKELGIAGDETTQQLLSDIGIMVSSAGDLAMGIASGNPLQIIQSSIGLLTSAFKVFNVQDRKAERQIAKHAENVKNLEKSYIDLEKAVNKALGSGRYKSSQDAIKNLEKQQKELAKQADLERSKKKSDKGKVEEYESAMKAAADKQKELVQQLRDDILAIDAKSAAEQLGQAFIDAFKAGEDGIEAFGKKADDIVGNIMQKMLVQKLLEQPLGNIMDKYSKKWINDKGDFMGFDAVIKDADAMGKEMSGLGEGFAKAMENLPDEIKKYFTGEQQAMGETAPLSGAIKGVSEETATKLGGQMNAIRINQLEATELIRQQLMHLSVIAINTGYIKSIDDRMARMEASNSSLRSQGLSA